MTTPTIFKPLDLPGSEPARPVEYKIGKPLPNPRGNISPEEEAKSKSGGLAMIAEIRNRPPLSPQQRSLRNAKARRIDDIRQAGIARARARYKF